jgi:hypothetical protein
MTHPRRKVGTSTDRTVELLRNHPKVALILANGAWETDIKARRTAEHRHRQLLLQCAREQLRFDWMFCFDADERILGDLRSFVSGPRAESCDGVSIQLFDAYLTPDDYTPYRRGQELLGFRRFYGPDEYRWPPMMMDRLFVVWLQGYLKHTEPFVLEDNFVMLRSRYRGGI